MALKGSPLGGLQAGVTEGTVWYFWDPLVPHSVGGCDFTYILGRAGIILGWFCLYQLSIGYGLMDFQDLAFIVEALYPPTPKKKNRPAHKPPPSNKNMHNIKKMA